MEKSNATKAATDFFERQDSARKRTWLLVFFFIIGVLTVALSIWPVVVGCATAFFWLAALITLFADPSEAAEIATTGALLFYDGIRIPNAFLVATLLGGIAICVGTLYKIGELKRLGASGVAEKLGGTRIDRSTTEPNEKRFYDLVEEMAVACGLPVPSVYVLPKENEINACAIGGDPSDSAVAATAGALRLLTRDELQGVVAHEFGHLVNDDVKLNMRLIGLVYGLQILAIIGGAGMKNEFAQIRKRKGALAPLWLALLLLGGTGVFVGEIIRAAVSRQREFLADALAAQFTRNPLGLANALKKIGGVTLAWKEVGGAKQGSTVSAARSTEMSHLFFGSVFSRRWGTRLFRTHPDLTRRIRRLEPSFNGVFPKFVIVKLSEQSA